MEAKLPFLEPMKSVEMTKRYMDIEDMKIMSERNGDSLHVGMTDFREPFKMLVRIRNKKIRNVSSGKYKEVYKAGNSRIYLITVEKEDMTLHLGD